MAKQHFAELIHRLRAVLVSNKEEMRSDAKLLERYVDERDQDAFTALVARHCQAVWGVCLGFFSDSPDAEDVFQATFLRLARKAASIRCEGNSIRGWLCRVASRTALDLRRSNSRQAKLKLRLSQETPPEPREFEPDRSKVWEMVVEELAQLPSHYREPLENSLLRGQSSRESASELGCSHVTIQQRIERGQRILCERLQKRGVVLTGGSTALTAFAITKSASAMPSADLLTRTAESALAYGAGQAVSGNAVALAGGAGLAIKGKFLLVVALCILGLAGSVVWVTVPRDAKGPAAPDGVHRAAMNIENPADLGVAEASSTDDINHITGRVLDADGKHVANAEVVVLGRRPFQPGEFGVVDDIVGRTRTDAKGQFSIEFRQSTDYNFLKLWAAAPNMAGVGVAHYAQTGLPVDIRAPRPETICGIVRDVRGAPVSGASVSVCQIGAVSFDPAHAIPNADVLPLWPQIVATKEDGSFELCGLNPKTEIAIRVDDDRYAPGKIVLHTNQWSGKTGLIELQPPRLLEGRVIAADTKQPLAQARVTVSCMDDAKQRLHAPVLALTNGAGAFRIKATWGEHYRISIIASEGAPYLPSTQTLDFANGEVQKSFDIEVPRGILMSGRVTDLDTGKPLSHVRAHFIPDPTDMSDGTVTLFQRFATTASDGRFQLVVKNLAGHLAFEERSGDYVIERVPWGADAMIPNRRISGNRLIRIEPQATAVDRELNVVLQRGVRIQGHVVGPDGKPVSDGMLMSQALSPPQEVLPGRPQRFRGGRFTLRGCTPGRIYPVLFLDGKNNIGARADLRADVDGRPVFVKLQHCGEATARVVDEFGDAISRFAPTIWLMAPADYAADGNDKDSANRAEVEQGLTGFDVWNYRPGNGPAPDDHGFVVFPGLIPGVRYRMSDTRNGSGKTVDFEVSSGQSLTLSEMFNKDP